MPFIFKKAIHSLFLYGLMGITVVLLGVLAYYNWLLSIVGLILAAIPFYFIFNLDQSGKKGR